MIFHCKFCQKDISESRSPQIMLDIDGYTCHTCNTFYAVEIFTGDIIDYAISTVVDGKSYHMYFEVFKNEFELQSVVRHPTSNMEFKSILKLDFLPDITPFNAKEKIPTLVTFS